LQSLLNSFTEDIDTHVDIDTHAVAYTRMRLIGVVRLQYNV